MRTDAEIVAIHLNRLIEEREPLLTTFAESIGPKTVALYAEPMEGGQTYRKEYSTEGYTSIDRAAPEEILAAFERASAHAFSLGGPGAPEREKA